MIDHTLVRQNTIFGDGIVTGDLAINGGDLTTTATTLNLFTANVTTATLFSAATTIAIGAPTGTLTLNNPSVRFAAGAFNLPSITFAGDPDTGFYSAAANVIGINISGDVYYHLKADGIYLLTTNPKILFGASSDLVLVRDAANTLALRNGVNAQTFRVYTSYTDASNYERFAINTAAGAITLAASTLGTGTDDIDLILSPAGVGGVKVGSGAATARLQVAGNLSKSAWTTTGIAFDVAAATFTDISTAGAGTVAVRTANSFGAPTFASTNAITVTDAFTLYVPKPIAGTNTTITRANSAYFEGSVGIGTTSPLFTFHVVGSIYGTSTIQSGSGSASNPSHSFGADSNTGMYSGGTDKIAFSTNGALTETIDALGNVIIGATAAGASATANFVLGGGATSPVLGAATADLVSLAAVDKAAGDRRLYIQSEIGSVMSVGNDRLNYGAATGTISIASTDTLFLTTTVLTFVEAVNIAVGTTTGTKIGTATSQKLGLWNATPIVQPTTAHAAATFVANTSGIANDTATWDGYTIGQVVKALRDVGALA